jgi:hypothetical protein
MLISLMACTLKTIPRAQRAQKADVDIIERNQTASRWNRGRICWCHPNDLAADLLAQGAAFFSLFGREIPVPAI